MSRPDTSPEEEQRGALEQGFKHADLTLEELWTRYFALGGNLDLVDLEAFLAGLTTLPEPDRDVLAHAVNERLDELRWRRRVPYSRPFRERRPATGPLAALVQLLEAAHAAAPDRLPEIAASAGRSMDVDVVVHLVDHDQRLLHRLTAGGRAEQPPLAVDGTLAGRVFQTVRVLPSESGDRPRLWVPLLDGSDRLGVLEVGLRSAAELYDPALREQCGWLAGLLGHVVASMSPYGDEVERARRLRSRSPSAELIWQQLPPLTASTGAFTLAGLVEPSYSAGGDAFDYALSERTVSLAVFDAMGHGLPAALMAAAALAGYRSARRDGRGLYDQVRAVDEVVARQFPGSAFVTGVLAELDVGSGRLRFVRAGHPPPLLLRGGKVVKDLDAGRRLPFGLGSAELAVAEEVLQPGDWLVLHTDGVTEARDASGAWFGEERLVDFLRRAAAAGQPPPETVRRLTRAVLAHQEGQLQDDATILLASWSRDRAV
ncbi:PP2C family protein-serine/threonine phosphatase [Geodermatophilus sp. SYSU D00815]